MIEERTKFYNGLDKKYYMDKVLHEFLDVYDSVTEKKFVNKMSAEIVQLINEYIEKYIYFSKLTTVIAEFLKNIYGTQNKYFSNFLSIKKSCKKQYGLLCLVKRISKKIPLERKYYVALKYNIEKISQRLDYLLNNVVFTYLEITPILDYSTKLESEGKTLEADITENIDFKEDFTDDKNVMDYVQKVLNSLENSNGEYLKNKEKYETFLNKKYEIVEDEKNEQKQKQKEIRFLETEAKLQQDARNIERSINNGNLYKYSSNIVALGKKFSLLKDKGNKYGRIILVGKTKAGSRAATYYLSGEELTNSLAKASVFTQNEKIPNKIQELIDNKDYAIAEILVIL